MSDIILNDKGEFNYFKSFLDSLCSIADKEFQENAWIDGDCSAYVDFDEVYMHFSHLCKDILTWRDLPEDKIRLIKTFYEMVKDYNEFYDQEEKTEKEVCNDPKWHKIRVLAKNLYDNLKDVKYVPTEKG